MRRRLLLGTILALACAPALGSSFEKTDSDGDGGVSQDELRGTLNDSGAYEAWDRDRDGLVDTEDFAAAETGDDFETWDSDGDGNVDEGEFYERAFRNFDEDKDGILSSGEWDAAKGVQWLGL